MVADITLLKFNTSGGLGNWIKCLFHSLTLARSDHKEGSGWVAGGFGSKMGSANSWKFADNAFFFLLHLLGRMLAGLILGPSMRTGN